MTVVPALAPAPARTAITCAAAARNLGAAADDVRAAASWLAARITAGTSDPDMPGADLDDNDIIPTGQNVWGRPDYQMSRAAFFAVAAVLVDHLHEESTH